MKGLKNLVFTILFLTIGLVGYGQTLALKIGANLAQLDMSSTSFSSFKHTTPNANLHAGLSLNFQISELLSVEPMVMFTKKNVRYQEGEPQSGFFFKSEYGLSYMEIPIPVKVHFRPNDQNFFIFAGPYLGLGMKGEVNIKQETTVKETLEEHTVWKGDHRLKRTDYGLHLGVGAVFKDFQIDIFYNLGFVDIANPFDDIESAKNRAIGISFALRFDTDY